MEATAIPGFGNDVDTVGGDEVSSAATTAAWVFTEAMVVEDGEVTSRGGVNSASSGSSMTSSVALRKKRNSRVNDEKSVAVRDCCSD